MIKSSQVTISEEKKGSVNAFGQSQRSNKCGEGSEMFDQQLSREERCRTGRIIFVNHVVDNMINNFWKERESVEEWHIVVLLWNSMLKTG